MSLSGWEGEVGGGEEKLKDKSFNDTTAYQGQYL